MAKVSVNINGRQYPIACEDGQEEHVTRLAAYVDRRATDLAGEIGQVGAAQLLIMVSLLVADELSDAFNEIERLQAEAKELEGQARDQARAQLDKALAPAVDGLAERIEAIAARLESH